MQIITVVSQKGGVGKTTTAGILAQAGVKEGKRVLCVDLDQQANLSFFLNVRPTTEGGSFALLNGEDPAKLIVRSSQGMDIIPASRNLAVIDSFRGSSRRLRDALEPIKENYDFVFIDTTTSGELQLNALMCATGLILPVEATVYALQSLYLITDTARQIKTGNSNLTVSGFIITKYDNRPKLNRKIKDHLLEQGEKMGVPYLGTVRRASVAEEATALQRSIYEYAPKSYPAQDYLEIFKKL